MHDQPSGSRTGSVSAEQVTDNERLYLTLESIYFVASAVLPPSQGKNAVIALMRMIGQQVRGDDPRLQLSWDDAEWREGVRALLDLGLAHRDPGGAVLPARDLWNAGYALLWETYGPPVSGATLAASLGIEALPVHIDEWMPPEPEPEPWPTKPKKRRRTHVPKASKP